MKNSNQEANMKNLTLEKMSNFIFKTLRTTLFIAGMLLTTVGTQSFGLDSNALKIDSNISVYNTTSDINDEIRNIKISLPSHRAVYRADREMNRNMSIEIKKLNNLKISMPVYIEVDQNINQLFYGQFTIAKNYSNDVATDHQITAEFYAYNINSNFSLLTLNADNEINNNFYSEYK